MSTDLEIVQTEIDAMRNALEHFEVCVETPFIPGELERLSDATASALRDLRTALEAHYRRVHASDFGRMSEEDDESLPRIEELKREDQAILEEAAKLEAWIAALLPRVRAVTPDELRVRDQLADFMKRSLEFVMRVRKQEVAVRTWLGEAFTRDRGTVD